MPWGTVANIRGPQGVQGNPGSPGSPGILGGVLRKTANQTLTLTSQVAIADMGFAVEANSKYHFDIHITITTSSGTAPTSNYGFTGPAGAIVAINRIQQISATGWATTVITSFTTFGASAQVANSMARFQGVIETAGTPGTVQLTVARAGTAPSMIIVQGSVGHWLKLP